MDDKEYEYQYSPVAGNNNNNVKYEAGSEIVIVTDHNIQCSPASEMTSVGKFLYIAACTANLASFTCGITFGWTSPVLPKLAGNSTNPLPEPTTTAQSSWIGSLLPVGAAIGPFAAGIVADKIGRKNTLLLAAVPFIIAFISFAYAENVLLIYLGRFLCGLGVGGTFTVLPMYIGEIAEDSVRGALGSMMQLFITFGILFAYSVGPYVDIKSFNLISVIIPALFLSTFYFFIPESPYYLMAVPNEAEAEKALMKIRSKPSGEVRKELDVIKSSVEESMANKATFMDIFKSDGLKKALMLSVGLVALQQLSGINAILFYTETIFEATGSTIPANISTIIVGIVQVTFSCVTPILVDRKGKRFLLLTSALGMAASHIALGFYFLRKDVGHSVDSLFWLPIFCLIFYNATYCVGFGPLPWAVMGELFPANVKSAASTVTASGCWILSFIITKYFSTMLSLLGNGYSFWAFGVCCMFGGFFVYRYLPETSGRSLKEIQDILEGSKK